MKLHLILWILFGAVAGWLASVIMRTNRVQGFFADITVGVLGAVLGGLLFGFFGAPGVTGFDLYSLMVAVVGSIVLIWGYRMIYRSR